MVPPKNIKINQIQKFLLQNMPLQLIIVRLWGEITKGPGDIFRSGDYSDVLQPGCSILRTVIYITPKIQVFSNSII